MLSLYNHLHHIGVRTIINNIREEIGLLESEIDFLTDSVDDLQAEADVLVGLEGSLQDIAKAQGKNIEELVGLVNENEETLRYVVSFLYFAICLSRIFILMILFLSQMKSNLTQTFVTGTFSFVLHCHLPFQTLILMALPRL